MKKNIFFVLLIIFILLSYLVNIKYRNKEMFEGDKEMFVGENIQSIKIYNDHYSVDRDVKTFNNISRINLINNHLKSNQYNLDKKILDKFYEHTEGIEKFKRVGIGKDKDIQKIYYLKFNNQTGMAFKLKSGQVEVSEYNYNSNVTLFNNLKNLKNTEIAQNIFRIFNLNNNTVFCLNNIFKNNGSKYTKAIHFQVAPNININDIKIKQLIELMNLYNEYDLRVFKQNDFRVNTIGIGEKYINLYY